MTPAEGTAGLVPRRRARLTTAGPALRPRRAARLSANGTAHGAGGKGGEGRCRKTARRARIGPREPSPETRARRRCAASGVHSGPTPARGSGPGRPPGKGAAEECMKPARLPNRGQGVWVVLSDPWAPESFKAPSVRAERRRQEGVCRASPESAARGLSPGTGTGSLRLPRGAAGPQRARPPGPQGERGRQGHTGCRREGGPGRAGPPADGDTGHPHGLRWSRGPSRRLSA